MYSSFGQNEFSIQKSNFWKIRNLVFDKISITQKEFKMFVTWFDFYSNKFIFQISCKNLFLWIFRDFMGFNRIIKTKISSPDFLSARLWRSTDRSTGPGAGRPEWSTGCARDVHKGHLVWPADRAVDRLKSPYSQVRTVDRAVDRRLATVKFRPLAGRPAGRPDGQFWPCLWLQRLVFLKGL